MPSSDWTPGLADVGSVLRARTKDDNGSELGTFSAATRPTDAQVDIQIGQAISDVQSAVGTADLPEPVWDEARYVTSLGAAMLVELSYFPEQIGTGRSPYAQIKELYDERLKRLKTAANAAGDDSEPGESPSFSFPMTGDPFILGRRTAW